MYTIYLLTSEAYTLCTRTDNFNDAKRRAYDEMEGNSTAVIADSNGTVVWSSNGFYDGMDTGEMYQHWQLCQES